MDANTTATTTVPPVDWHALHNLDWSVPVYLMGFFVTMFFFGAMVGAIGLFCSLWLVWIGIMLMQFGFHALFINPFYIVLNAMLLAGVSWLILTVFGAVTQAPTKLYRHFTK